MLGMNNPGQGIGIAGHGVNIEEPGNVGAAVADEDRSADTLFGDFAFGREFRCPSQAVAPSHQQATGLSRSGTRLDQ